MCSYETKNVIDYSVNVNNNSAKFRFTSGCGQGSKGIYKTIADKLMYIPNNDKQNYPFCRLQLVVETIGHLT